MKHLIKKILQTIISENEIKKNIDFEILKQMSEKQILDFYKGEIDYKLQEPLKFYKCYFNLLNKIDNRIEVKNIEIKPFIDKERSFIPGSSQSISIFFVTEITYNIIGSNSEEILSNAEKKIGTQKNIREYNKCSRQSLPPNWKMEEIFRNYTPSLNFAPYEKRIMIPIKSLQDAREKSVLYKDFKKYIGKKIPYPGDEKKSSFIDKLLQIKGSKPESESKGEKMIRIFLENKNVQFKQYFRISECFSQLNNKCYVLPFDFYIPKTNTLIEYDGEQHFRPVEKFGGEKTYQRQLILDEIKNKFAKDNGYLLIRIPFTVKNERLLSDYLSDEILGLE